MNAFISDPFLPHILEAIRPKERKLRRMFDTVLDELEGKVNDAENFAGSGMSRQQFNQALHEHRVGNACDGE